MVGAQVGIESQELPWPPGLVEARSGHGMQGSPQAVYHGMKDLIHFILRSGRNPRVGLLWEVH